MMKQFLTSVGASVVVFGMAGQAAHGAPPARPHLADVDCAPQTIIVGEGSKSTPRWRSSTAICTWYIKAL